MILYMNNKIIILNNIKKFQIINNIMKNNILLNFSNKF
jgi:hypothetical protein